MKKSLALIITLISILTITSTLTGCLLQLNSAITTTMDNNQNSTQMSLVTSLTDINKTTSRLNIVSLSDDYSTSSLTTIVSLDKTNPESKQQNQLLYLIPKFTNYEQSTELETITPTYLPEASSIDSFNEAYFKYNESSSSITSASASFDTINFTTYSYGGYPVQQPGFNQFLFAFPDSTDEGQLAGSDAFSLNTYSIQKIDFNALFTTPKIGAIGFDEMAVFAASNTISYKGTEFGIRMGLSDGYIYGYIQEPNGRNGDIDFQMLKLASNDGITHHFTLIMQGEAVDFYFDGANYGQLSYASKTDYSSLTFSVLAVVHRFTDDWDSNGDNMTVENFAINQP